MQPLCTGILLATCTYTDQDIKCEICTVDSKFYSKLVSTLATFGASGIAQGSAHLTYIDRSDCDGVPSTGVSVLRIHSQLILSIKSGGRIMIPMAEFCCYNASTRKLHDAAALNPHNYSLI